MADSYIYKFSSDGIPKTRTSARTGEVEIYTNLHKIKVNEHILHKIHSTSYAGMTYKDFLEATRTKYPKLLFSFKNDNHEWLNHNEYKYIQSLVRIDTFLKE